MSNTEPYADPVLEAVRQGFIKAGWLSPTDNLIHELAAVMMEYGAQMYQRGRRELMDEINAELPEGPLGIS